MSNPQPPDLSLAESMVALHEIFTSALAAGFTIDQAMHLTARALRPQCDCGGVK